MMAKIRDLYLWRILLGCPIFIVIYIGFGSFYPFVRNSSFIFIKQVNLNQKCSFPSLELSLSSLYILIV